MRSPHSPRSARRHALLIVAGVASAAGGLYLGLRRWGDGNGPSSASPALPAHPVAAASPANTASHAEAPMVAQGDTLTPAFWAQAFETPGGTALPLAPLKGKPLLINFWATWCPPCVKEMPELDRFNRDFSPEGWQVLGLAVDGPTPVKEFLTKVRVGFAIGLAGFGGTELAQALGNQSGGLPFTVLIDAQGRVRHRKMGATSHAELAAWAKALK